MKKSLAWGGAVLVALISVSAPLSASAHDELVASTPTSGQTLTELPGTFSVTMNEPLLELDGSNAFALQIQDAAGAYYGDGCLTEDSATLSTAAALGEAGSYTLLWQVVSNDGHPVSGEIPFTWAPTADAQPSPALKAPPVCGEDPEPVVTESPETPTATPDPVAEAPTASAIDPALVFGIGGGVLAAGIVIAVVIIVTSRRRKA